MKMCRILAAAFACTVALCSCQHAPPAKRPEPTTVRFTPRPFGQDFPLHETSPQEGDAFGSRITGREFEELSFGQGGALEMPGYDTVRLRRDGSAEVVADFRDQTGRLIPLQFSPAEVRQVLAALNRDGVSTLRGSYASDLADGTVGYLAVRTTRGARWTWFSNYFTPVEHTIAILNALITPGVGAALADPGKLRQVSAFAEEQRAERMVKGR